MRGFCCLALVLLAVSAARALPVAMDADVVLMGRTSAAQLNATRYDVEATTLEAPVVNITGVGAVRGAAFTTDQTKRPYFSYFAIPFAEAPTGKRRFVAPVRKLPWEGVLDATASGKACLQTDESILAQVRRRRDATWEDRVIPATEQSEDCLILDVHTPKADRSAKLPVLVFFHGGGFLTGSAQSSYPQGLLEDDIVLVSPQYRLGALGYLNIQHEAVPGNGGFLDQVEALRWVQDNIEHFGGDPSRVTLGGHSAGAASASLLYLSPLTKGLFHAVMPMSGSALGFWSYDRTPEFAGSVITALSLCGGPETSIEKRVECLQTVPAKQIVQGFILYAVAAMFGGNLGMSGATPSVSKAGVQVLPDFPENILASKDFEPLPYMTGVTKHEGSYPLKLAVAGYLTPNHLLNNATFLRNDLIHVLLKVIGHDDPAGFVADSALGAFFDPTTLGDYQAMLDGLTDFTGTFAFKSPARRIVQHNAERGATSYLYAFNYNGIVSKNSAEGVYHGADQPYLFPRAGIPLVGDDLNIALALRKVVANFVIYQNPIPPQSPVPVAAGLTWEPYARDSEHYLELDWPPAERQWFSTQFTVARADQYIEGGNVSTVKPPSTKSGRNNDDDDDDNAAAVAAPSVTIAVAAAVAALVATW